MSIDFTPWPEALARRYRERGYWTDRPLTDIIARQAKNDAVALIDPQRSLSYRRLNQLSDRLAAALQRRGLRSGDTALVQLGNVVEFYVAFFALLKIGVVPVNALFSHQRNELKAYAAQIKPALLIADRQHGLFGNDEFLTAFRAENPSLRVVALRSQEEGEQSLAAWLEEDAEDFIATPTPADQVAFFQLSGGSTGTPKLIPRTHNDYYYSIRRSVEICHFDAHTRYLCALPVAHNYPMSSPGVLGVFYGAGLVVFASDPDAGQCFRLIEQHQINVTALVPPAVTLWLQAIEEWGGQPLASLKLLQVGGPS
ncbi:Enterobactin synthase component E [Serratia plymuthica]|nr:Enterobactin synthase component E [Serratia plymuthica]